MFERFFSLLLPLLLGVPLSHAADIEVAPHELWSGHYRCGPMLENAARFPSYKAAIRLIVDNGDASITKESARIKEMLAGKIAADGRLVLEGTGFYKAIGEPNWRYRFEGQFEGVSFSATGMMLATSSGMKLRDCSMELTRVSTSQQAPQQAVHPLSGKDRVAAAKSKITATSTARRTAAPESQVTGRSMRTASPALESAPASPHVGANTAPAGVAQLDHNLDAEAQAGARADSVEHVARARARLSAAETPANAGQANIKVSEQAPVAALAPQRPDNLTLNRWPPNIPPGANETIREGMFAVWLLALGLFWVTAIVVRKHMRYRAAPASHSESWLYGFWRGRNVAVAGPNLITRAVAAAQRRAKADAASH